MRTKLLFVGIAGLLVAALGAASLTAAAGTPAPGQTLHFEVQFHDDVLAKSSSGLSLGDAIVLHDTLLADGTPVGHNGGVCTITDPAGEAACTVTWDLGDGTIATQFLNAPPPRKVFAVVGGTGRYEGARGSGELIEAPDQTGTLAFHLAG